MLARITADGRCARHVRHVSIFTSFISSPAISLAFLPSMEARPHATQTNQTGTYRVRYVTKTDETELRSGYVTLFPSLPQTHISLLRSAYGMWCVVCGSSSTQAL